MKRAIVFFVLVAVGFVESTFDSGLRVTFGIELKPGNDYFNKIPQYIKEAIEMNWLPMERPPSPLPTLPMYCVPELTICGLYNNITGFIAGYQIALPINNNTDALFDWGIQGFIPWKPSVVSGQPDTYMTKQLYFISEETLAKTPEECNQTALAKEVLQEKSVWVVGFHGKLMKIPVDVEGMVDVGFTKQACFPLMGLHYYYKMSAETQCRADTLLNWFPLTSDGRMIGMGFMSVYALKAKKGEKFYCENPQTFAVKMIVPRGPKCLYELADNPTLTTMHVYFIDKPWTELCLPFGK